MPETLAALLVSVGLDMAPLLRGLSEAPKLAQAQLAAGMEQATRAATASVASAASQQTAAVSAGARAQASVTAAAAAGQRREWDGLNLHFATTQKEMEAAFNNRIAAENRQQRDETAFIKQQLAEQKAAAKAARDESSIPQRTTGANRRALANQVGGGMETVGAVVLGGLGFAAEQAGKFQTVLTDMRTNTQMTDAEFDIFSKTTLQLGETLGASTDKVADAFRVVKDFGFNTADSLNIVTAATRSAVATNSDASVTTEFLAQTLHSFHDPASKAGEDMNLLHQAALKGHASMEQFVQSARDGFAIAGGFGQSLKDTAAVYATLTLNGFNAAEATTQLKNMLQHIANPAAAARAEIEKLSERTGVDLRTDFTAAGLAAKGLPAVLDDVARATAGNSAEAFKLINAQRGGFGAFLLAGKGAQDLHDILGNLSEVTGGKLDPITQGLAQRMGTLQNQVERTNNRFLESYTKVAPVVLPFLETLMKDIGDLLDRFNALAPDVQAGIVKMAAWGGAVSLAGGFVLKLVTGVKEFAEVVAGAKLLGALSAFEKALAAPVAEGTVGAALLGGGAARGAATGAAAAGAAAGGAGWGATATGATLGGSVLAASLVAAPVALKLSANLAADQAQEAQARAQELTPILHALKPYEDELDTLRAKLTNFRYDDAKSWAANKAGLEHLRAEIANRSRELSQMAGQMLDGKPAPKTSPGDDPKMKAMMAQAVADDAAWDREHAAAEKAQAAHHKKVEAEAARFHEAMAAARAKLADLARGDKSPTEKVAAQFPDLSAARRRELVDIDNQITKVREQQKALEESRKAHERYAAALGEVYAKIRDARQGPKSDAAQLQTKFPGASPQDIAQLVAAQQTLRGIEAAHKAAAAAAESNRAAHKRLSDQIVSVRKELTVHKNETDLDRLSQEYFGRAFGTLTAATQAQVRALASEDAALAANTAATEAAAKAKAELEATRSSIAAQIRDDSLQVRLEKLGLDENSVAYQENALAIQNWHKMFADVTGDDAKKIEQLAQLTLTLKGASQAAAQAGSALTSEIDDVYAAQRRQLNLGGAGETYTVPTPRFTNTAIPVSSQYSLDQAYNFLYPGPYGSAPGYAGVPAAAAPPATSPTVNIHLNNPNFADPRSANQRMQDIGAAVQQAYGRLGG